MTKIVYNACFGSFGLSTAAVIRARELSGDKFWQGITLFGETYSDGSKVSHDYNSYSCYNLPRHDPILIQVVEELGKKASGQYADLQLRDIPPGTKYRIDEYDGAESVITVDEYEWEVAP